MYNVKMEEFYQGRIAAASLVGTTVYPGHHAIKSGTNEIIDSNHPNIGDNTLSGGSVQAIKFVASYAYDDVVKKDEIIKNLENKDVPEDDVEHRIAKILTSNIPKNGVFLESKDYVLGALSKLLELKAMELTPQELLEVDNRINELYKNIQQYDIVEQEYMIPGIWLPEKGSLPDRLDALMAAKNNEEIVRYGVEELRGPKTQIENERLDNLIRATKTAIDDFSTLSKLSIDQLNQMAINLTTEYQTVNTHTNTL